MNPHIHTPLLSLVKQTSSSEPEDLDGVVNLQLAFSKATEGSPRLAYSAKAAASTTKARHPRNMLQGIRRRGIRQMTYETLFVKREGNFSVCVGLARNERGETPSSPQNS